VYDPVVGLALAESFPHQSVVVSVELHCQLVIRRLKERHYLLPKRHHAPFPAAFHVTTSHRFSSNHIRFFPAAHFIGFLLSGRREALTVLTGLPNRSLCCAGSDTIDDVIALTAATLNCQRTLLNVRNLTLDHTGIVRISSCELQYLQVYVFVCRLLSRT